MMGIFLLLAILCGIAVTFYVFYNLNDLVIIASLIVGETGLVFTFLILLCSGCGRYRRFLSFDAIVHIDVNDFLSHMNSSTFYARKAIQWKLQKRRFWLELNVGTPAYHGGNQSNIDLLEDQEVQNSSSLKVRAVDTTANTAGNDLTGLGKRRASG